MIKRIFLFQAILLSTIFTAYTMSTERIFPLTEQERDIKGPPGYRYTLMSDVFINYETDTIAAWVSFAPCDSENLIINLSVIKNIITGNFEISTYQELRTTGSFFWDFNL